MIMGGGPAWSENRLYRSCSPEVTPGTPNLTQQTDSENRKHGSKPRGEQWGLGLRGARERFRFSQVTVFSSSSTLIL